MPEVGASSKRSLHLLKPRDRRRYQLAVGLQMSTAVLDLLGVALFGLVGVVSVAAVQGGQAPAPVEAAIGWLGLDWALSQVALCLALLAAAALILKSAAMLVTMRWFGRFLARCSADLSAEFARDYFSLPVVGVQRFDTQWVAYALGQGVTGAVVDVLLSATTVKVESMLLLGIGAALLVADPLTSALVIGYFGAVVVIFQRWLGGWAARSGRALAETDIAAIVSVFDTMATYREMTVADRRGHFIDRFARLRKGGAHAYADQNFFGQLPRYGFEAAMVLGAGIMAVLLLVTSTPEAAVASMVLFLVAASRVMPSLLRLNGARLGLRSLAARAQYAYTMAEYLAEETRRSDSAGCAGAAGDPGAPGSSDVVAVSGASAGLAGAGRGGGTPAPATVDVRAADPRPVRLRPEVEVANVTIRYPNSVRPAVDDVSVTVPVGGRLALVGPSGAGKSTLADAILGVARPESGLVRIGGLPPGRAVKAHPGAIAYVPQEVALISGTVRDNVAIGMVPGDIDDHQVWAVLEAANLAQFVRTGPDGLDTPVGERGVRLSGGQKQRLGIARALYTDPQLIVLDEATSSLDAQTESYVGQTLRQLGPSVTTITVAHRLATVRHCDIVLYMEDGRALARGTFDQVRELLPQFDRQAQLLGL